MTDYELYEYIFCTQEGSEKRSELVEKYKDRLPELKTEHEKYGLKLNGVALPFENFI